MIFRTLGLWSVLIAVLTLVIDATKSFKDEQSWVTTTLGEQWRDLNEASLLSFRDIVVEQLGTPAWDNAMTLALQAPTWMVFAVLGGLFYWAGRRRHRIEVFSN